MNNQISFLGKEFCTEEEIAELERQAEIFADYAKKKRRWENAFQKWSNYMGLGGIYRRLQRKKIRRKKRTRA